MGIITQHKVTNPTSQYRLRTNRPPSCNVTNPLRIRYEFRLSTPGYGTVLLVLVAKHKGNKQDSWDLEQDSWDLSSPTAGGAGGGTPFSTLRKNGDGLGNQSFYCLDELVNANCRILASMERKTYTRFTLTYS